MRILVWLVRAAIFFILFAFALKNLDDARVLWFFGQEWHAPMIFIVLAAFALGCAFGVFAMVPAWWKHRRVARKHAPVVVVPTEPTISNLPSDSNLPHPSRDGL